MAYVITCDCHDAIVAATTEDNPELGTVLKEWCEDGFTPQQVTNEEIREGEWCSGQEENEDQMEMV